MKGSAAKIQMTGLDELFGIPAQEPGEHVQEIALSELHTFHNHPFHVVDDEKMEEMAESVAQYGVLVPGIVRPRPEGGYELIAGHRRKRACELAGLKSMRVIVRDMDDDEAVLIMVDSNLQREKILPSEKAFAYRMKLEAMKRQGQRTDLTSSPVGMKLAIHIGLTEFVLGVHSTAPSQFVTWACKGGNDYYWGHYHSDLLLATKDLLERATQELEFCMESRARAQEQTPQKEQEEPCL